MTLRWHDWNTQISIIAGFWTLHNITIIRNEHYSMGCAFFYSDARIALQEVNFQNEIPNAGSPCGVLFYIQIVFP